VVYFFPDTVSKPGQSIKRTVAVDIFTISAIMEISGCEKISKGRGFMYAHANQRVKPKGDTLHLKCKSRQCGGSVLTPQQKGLPRTPARCTCWNHALVGRCTLADTHASVRHVRTPLPPWKTAVLSAVLLTVVLRLFN